jgi:hypothetical protein
MNLEKAVNHGDTAKNQKPVFAFASRRVRCVAVVNVFESVDLQPGRLKIKRVSYIYVRRDALRFPDLPASYDIRVCDSPESSIY